MTNLTKNQMIKEIRAIAKTNGLVFRVDTDLNINGVAAYELVDRSNRCVVMSNMTVSSAYEKAISGGFARLD